MSQWGLRLTRGTVLVAYSVAALVSLLWRGETTYRSEWIHRLLLITLVVGALAGARGARTRLRNGDKTIPLTIAVALIPLATGVALLFTSRTWEPSWWVAHLGLLTFAVVLSAEVPVSRLGPLSRSVDLGLNRFGEQVLASINDGLGLRDSKGRLVLWNPAAVKLTGWTSEEAAERFPTDLREGLVDLGEGKWIDVRHFGFRRHGLLFEGALFSDARALVGLREAKEEAEAAQVEAEKAQTEAERANAAKSQFVSRMSHEFRTPLTSIIGFSNLLESQDISEQQLEMAAMIHEAGEHLLSLINDVLDISQVESGSLSLAIDQVPAEPMLKEVLDLMRPLAATWGISLRGPLMHDTDPVLRVDRRRAKQIFLNLVSNAIKYNRPNGSVTLRCSQVGDLARLVVEDTGRGIAEQQLDKLFTPYERLGAEETDIEGTGLGLALSKRLVEAMGGRIDARSTLGEGSAFWVDLPIATGAVRTKVADEPASDHRKKKVVYIEDSLATFKLVEKALDRPDIELMEALQGSLGIELARLHRPALILLDFNLPDLRGDEVLRRLQADDSTADIPVIVISADATEQNIRRMLALGARRYLTKPLNLALFNAEVDAVLREFERSSTQRTAS